MSKFKTFVVVLVLASMAAISTVYAQYDTEIVEPTIEDDGEVYGINIVASEKVVLYPRSCSSILSVTIEAANKIKGDMIINAVEKAPNDDKLTNIYEICEIKLVDIEADDFENVEVDFKVTKSWMEDNDVNAGDIAFFTYDNDKSDWDKEDTKEKSENSIYQYFTTEPSNLTHWAIAIDDDGSFSISNTGWVLGICLFSLLIIIILVIFIALRQRKQEETVEEPIDNN